MTNAASPKSLIALGTDQLYREVGRRIRALRQLKKINGKDITQESLALSVGLTRTSLTNIEKGRQKLLLHTFTQIAAILGVSPNELLPDTTTILKDLGLNLPCELPQDERGFIERTMSPGGTYAPTKTKSHTRPSQQAAQAKRSKRSPG
jgi:transcriptional regulator with XRE-family HTH domain